MDSLLSVIEKANSKDDFVVESKMLTGKLLHKLLKWYDGNVYNQSNERVNNAVNILAWCYYRASDLEYLPREHREEYFKRASDTYKISYGKLVELFKTHSKLIFSSKDEPMIIAFEGIDGSGKTVQISLFEESLKKRGLNVTSKSFPDYDSFFGNQVGVFLSGDQDVNANNVDPKSMSLWYALDRWKSFENFSFQGFDYLLLNRFTLSSAVYQSSRVESQHRTEFVEWIFDLEHSQLGLPAPDLYIVFDLNPETSKMNIAKKGHREYIGEKPDVYEESSNIMNDARSIYQKLANKYKNIIIINCLDENNNMKPPHEINKSVIKVIEDGKY